MWLEWWFKLCRDLDSGRSAIIRVVVAKRLFGYMVLEP